MEGADGFAIIRSVIDTTIKSGNDVFYALKLIAIVVLNSYSFLNSYQIIV